MKPRPTASVDAPRNQRDSLGRLMTMACSLIPEQDVIQRHRLEKLLGDKVVEESVRAKAAEIAELLGEEECDPGMIRALRKDGQFNFHPSEDGMKLFLDIDPPFAGGEAVSRRAVLDKLSELNISRGVLLENLDRAVSIAAEGESKKDVLVCQGQLPRATVHEQAIYYLRRQHGEEPVAVHDIAAVRDAGDNWFCKSGDVIAEAAPGQRGQSGYDAWNNELPSEPVRPMTLPVGKNVRREGNQYIAEVSGIVFVSHGALEVRNMLVINKDVHRAASKINFDGDVLVRAGVRDGGQVWATGNITVTGPVEAAEIRSLGGSVFLRQGISGRNKGHIFAADSIITRHAENAMLHAENDLTIEKGAVHCHLIAGGKINCLRDRGQILGGVAMAGKNIEIKRAGAPAGIATELMVGLSSRLMRTLGRLDRMLQAYQDRRNEVLQTAEKIRRAVGDPHKLMPDQRRVFAMLLQSGLLLDLRLSRLNERRQKLLHVGSKDNSASIVVFNEVMPRVTVRIGDRAYKNEETLGPTRFTFSSRAGGIVKVHP